MKISSNYYAISKRARDPTKTTGSALERYISVTPIDGESKLIIPTLLR